MTHVTEPAEPARVHLHEFEQSVQCIVENNTSAPVHAFILENKHVHLCASGEIVNLH